MEEVAPLIALLFSYHWYEYDPVPPDADAVRVIALPTSVGFCEVDMLTYGSEFTVCVREVELVYPFESVTE